MAHDHLLVRKRNAIAHREQEPSKRPVTLTSIVRDPTFWVDGCITGDGFVAGRTLPEAERVLGLQTGTRAPGACLYDFMRLPRPDESELRGDTQCLDGQLWTEASDDPPGAGAPRWNVSRSAHIPGRLAAVIEPSDAVSVGPGPVRDAVRR